MCCRSLRGQWQRRSLHHKTHSEGKSWRTSWICPGRSPKDPRLTGQSATAAKNVYCQKCQRLSPRFTDDHRTGPGQIALSHCTSRIKGSGVDGLQRRVLPTNLGRYVLCFPVFKKNVIQVSG